MNEISKKIKEYKTELVFLIGNEENKKEEIREMHFRTPSMAAQDAFIKVREFHQRDMMKLGAEEKYKEFKSEETIDFGKLVGQSEKLLNAMEYQAKIIKLNSEYNVQYYKVIVDTKQLTTEMQEQFSSDPNSEFWQEQDLVMIEEAVSFFRMHIKI